MRPHHQIVSVFAALAAPAFAQEAPDVVVRDDLAEYRRIHIDVTLPSSHERRAVQIWIAGAPFESLRDAEVHSAIRIGDTSALSRTPIEEAYDACWSDGLPIHRDGSGESVLDANTAAFSCALSGMVPGVEHWIAVVSVNARGDPLHAVVSVPGRTDALDQRTPPPDTRPVLFALGAIVLSLVVLLTYLRWRDATQGRRGARLAHLYVAPAVIALAVLTFYPVAYGMWLAFTDAHQSHLGDQSWVGLANFGTIFVTPGVARVSLFTLVWAVANVSMHVCLGLLIATALTQPGLKGRTVYRTLLLLPWAIPGYISVLAWRGMLEPAGLLNAVLGTDLDWLAQPGAARTLVILVNIWLGVPFMMMALSGALQSVPQEMMEAAEVDGVGRWRQFRHLTLPSLKSVVVPLSLLGFIWTINMFHVIYLMTRGAPYVGFGEPGATDILITYVYDVAFEYGNYGVAAAWSVAIFLILLGFSWFYLKKTRALEAIA
ncbi:MAG: sugar ABC transporter permease [Gammaproteobacteria bacterium]|nr:sugar ABC transporter permease [Gammaproteobacteria bacterium]